MKAVTCRRYGPPDVLKIEELEKPVPKANEVLVKVYASTVTSGDAKLRGFRGAGIFWLPMRLMFGFLGLRNPILGMEFAGQIVAAGSAVNEFGVGDMVFGMKLGGANAEFVAIPETAAVALKPDALSFEQAAAVPFGALSALTYLRKFAMLQAGQKILINGASGAVGIFAVQLAREMGAHVTAVCSTRNINLVQSLGADRVIDYTVTDFTRDGSAYDVIFDAVGNTSFFECRRVMTKFGRHVFLVQQLPQILQALGTALMGGKRAICGINMTESRSDLMEIKELIEAGKIRPVIDITYPVRKIVEAHHYVDTGRKRGAVVVSLNASRSMQRPVSSQAHSDKVLAL
jgi:2-desacetyl-2-hydroxyethyl bacteriochlorophyllide A dehydrogenase